DQKVTLAHNLLKSQGDGIFDTDGLLMYNSHLKRILYTHYYRNEFIVANEALQLDYRGNTIDTVDQLNLEVINIKTKTKLATPTLLVNKSAATYGNYLYVNSQLPGRYETSETWSKNSIIDVYDLVKDTYEFSFKIKDIGSDKLKMFLVENDHFIGLIGENLVIYKLHTYAFEG